MNEETYIDYSIRELSADSKDLEASIKLPYVMKDKILMSPGVWNSYYYSQNAIVDAFNNTDWESKENRSLFLDHIDDRSREWVGEVINVRIEGEHVMGDLVLLDKPTAIKLDYGAKMGISPKVHGPAEDNVMHRFVFDNFSVVINPAVKTAYINNSQTGFSLDTIEDFIDIYKEFILSEDMENELSDFTTFVKQFIKDNPDIPVSEAIKKASKKYSEHKKGGNKMSEEEIIEEPKEEEVEEAEDVVEEVEEPKEEAPVEEPAEVKEMEDEEPKVEEEKEESKELSELKEMLTQVMAAVKDISQAIKTATKFEQGLPGKGMPAAPTQPFSGPGGKDVSESDINRQQKMSEEKPEEPKEEKKEEIKEMSDEIAKLKKENEKLTEKMNTPSRKSVKNEMSRADVDIDMEMLNYLKNSVH